MLYHATIYKDTGPGNPNETLHDGECTVDQVSKGTDDPFRLEVSQCHSVKKNLIRTD